MDYPSISINHRPECRLPSHEAAVRRIVRNRSGRNHAIGKDLVAVAAGEFRLIHGDIGILDQ
jgi:hypothetical protein